MSEFACGVCFRNRLQPVPHGFAVTFMVMTYMTYMIMMYMRGNDTESLYCWKWWGNIVNPDYTVALDAVVHESNPMSMEEGEALTRASVFALKYMWYCHIASLHAEAVGP